MISYADYKLGAKDPVHDKYGLHLSTIAPGILSRQPQNSSMRFTEINPENWILGDNDKIGDCTCVSGANSMLFRSTLRDENVLRVPTPRIINFYEIFGYNPQLTQPDGSNPTDQGAVLTNVMQTWMTRGYDTGSGINRLSGYGSIDPRNTNLIKNAIDLFEDVYTGVQLTVAQQTQEIWDYVPNSPIWGGHCIDIVGYDEEYFYGISWKKVFRITVRFILMQCMEMYALLDKVSFLSLDKAGVTGINYSALENVVRQLGGPIN